jgi:hypothetical protein
MIVPSKSSNAVLPDCREMRVNLWLLAKGDLFAPAAWGPSLFSIASVACTTALAILVLGVFWGYQAVSRYRASTGLIFGDPRFEEHRLTPSQVIDKEKDVRGKLKDPSVLMGCFPFVEARAQCYTLDVEGSRRYRPMVGRTVHGRSDPLIQTIPLQSGKGFTSDRDMGVIVSPAFLQSLALPDGAAPPVSVRYREIGGAKADEIEAPVVGVAAREFSARWNFLILESALLTLEAEHQDIPTTIVRTRPAPRNWRKADLPDSVRVRLGTFGVDEGRRVGEALEFTSNRPMSRENWLAIIRDVRRQLTGFVEKFPDAGGCFQDQYLELVVERSADASAALQTYHYVSLHTERPDAVEELVAAARPLPADPELAAKIAQLGDVARLGRVLVWVVPVLVLFTGFLNLLAIQRLRDATKLDEIGLLKAIGMSEGRLLDLFFLEALIVWGLGVVLGAIAAWPIGLAVRFVMAETPREFECAFFWLWPTAIGGAVSLVAVLAATYFGTYTSRRRPPIESFCAN